MLFLNGLFPVIFSDVVLYTVRDLYDFEFCEMSVGLGFQFLDDLYQNGIMALDLVILQHLVFVRLVTCREFP